MTSNQVGDVAERFAASQYKADGYRVANQLDAKSALTYKTPYGARIVDVQAFKPGFFGGEKLNIEVKGYGESLRGRVQGEIAKDVYLKNQNTLTRDFGKRLGIAGTALDAVTTGVTMQQRYAQGDNAGAALAGAQFGGRWAGSLAGAKIGALLGAAGGSFVPFVGNFAGGVIGGVGGAIVGGIAGESGVNWLNSVIRGDTSLYRDIGDPNSYSMSRDILSGSAMRSEYSRPSSVFEDGLTGGSSGGGGFGGGNFSGGGSVPAEIITRTEEDGIEFEYRKGDPVTPVSEISVDGRIVINVVGRNLQLEAEGWSERFEMDGHYWRVRQKPIQADSDLPPADPTSLEFSRGETGMMAAFRDRMDDLTSGGFNGQSGDGTRGLADQNDPLRRELAGDPNAVVDSALERAGIDDAQGHSGHTSQGQEVGTEALDWDGWGSGGDIGWGEPGYLESGIDSWGDVDGWGDTGESYFLDEADPLIIQFPNTGGSSRLVNPLESSTTFFDMSGDGIADRTTWASPGNGVLAIDANQDGKIDQRSEVTFTDWDGTAKSDLEVTCPPVVPRS